MNNIEKKSIDFKKKPLVIAIGYLVAGGLFSSNVSSAIPEDLNIYRQPTLGKTNLLLMIDSTAGMDDEQSGRPTRSIAKDYPLCATRNLSSESVNSLDSKYQFSHTLKDSSGRIKPTFVYPMPYCNDGTTEYKYSRMDRMKVAMTKLLSSTDISDNIVMGMGQFSTQTSKEYIINSGTTAQNNNTGSVAGVTQYFYTQNDAYKGLGGGDGASAKILLPAVPLSLDQRWKMRVAVNALNSGSRTPLAAALAESGAYMLGRTTLNNDGTSPGNFVITGQARLNGGSSYNKQYTASGFNSSVDSSKSGSRYQTPIETNTATCNSNGIFLLTNAAPSQTEVAVAQGLMRNALGDNSFTCPISNTTSILKSVISENKDYAWTCMGEFAKRLKESDQKIKVAVAGFGNNFMPYLAETASAQYLDANGKLRKYYKCNDLRIGKSYTVNGVTITVTQDTINACNLGEKSNDSADFNSNGKVGGFGEGGFYPIVSLDELVNSIKSFVADLQTDIPSLNSGLPAIPIDTLNATQALPFAYYSQFQPDTRSSQAVGIWVGNIKKYKAVDNTFKDKYSNNVINSTTGNLNSTTDFWSSSADGANATQGGVSAKLPVKTAVGRKIYTDRTVSGSTATSITSANTNLTLIASNNNTDATGTAEVLRASTDPDKAYLLNLLGFGISTPIVPNSLVDAVQLRQMGATINSTPLAFTTQSKIATKASGTGTTAVNVGDYIDRKDYILFGTSQGLLQVVDANTGEEKFSFLPKEMIDRQKNGFVAKSLQSGLTTFYSGIDGAWSVYANYVSNNISNSLKADKLNVYGGLRRGGANYYGLDLTSIETSVPKFLFKTLGSTTVDANGIPSGNCSNINPLNCMGQSWSKPAIGWVRWKGKPQLVMIVGGGYDPVYDSPTYKSNMTATKGNGIYIFAADSNTATGLTAGDLLWWGSSTATTTSASADNTIQKTANSDLKYSVVSEIKTVDRDSDGFIDNLYFGDLGGQVFRVDIDNLASQSTGDTARNFSIKRIVRIGNFIADAERATKAAPRFYNIPTFTAHLTGGLAGTSNATRYAVISIGSGDQSSPVSNSLTATDGIPDRVYGIFDRDIGRTDLYSITGETSLLTGIATTTNMQDIAANLTSVQMLENMKLATIKGWFNTLSSVALGKSGIDINSSLSTGVARYKVLSNFYAIKGTLFTSYFDAADNGTSSSCSAGIKGRSYIKNYCLPFGNMNVDGNNCGTNLDGRAFSSATGIGTDVGAGIIPIILGGMATNSGTSIGPLSGKSGAVSAQYKIPLRLEPLRWSEKNM